NGVKTGFTKRAGRCLVSAAKRDELQLILVVLNCGPMFEESSAILEYGFSMYKNRRIIDSSASVISVPIDNGIRQQVQLYPSDDYNVALTDDEYNNLHVKIEAPDILESPVKKGRIYGNIIISIDNENIREIPLISKSYVPTRPFGASIRRLFE